MCRAVARRCDVCGLLLHCAYVLMFASLATRVRQGWTPLDTAVHNNRLDVGVALARAGGIITKVPKRGVWTVHRGGVLTLFQAEYKQFALQVMAAAERWDDCKLLVQAGANAVSPLFPTFAPPSPQHAYVHRTRSAMRQRVCPVGLSLCCAVCVVVFMFM